MGGRGSSSASSPKVLGTYKQWQHSSKNELISNRRGYRLYTDTNVYNSAGRKTVGDVLQHVSDFKVGISKKNAEREIKAYKQAGFYVAGMYEEQTMTDYVFKRKR